MDNKFRRSALLYYSTGAGAYTYSPVCPKFAMQTIIRQSGAESKESSMYAIRKHSIIWCWSIIIIITIYNNYTQLSRTDCVCIYIAIYS